MTRIVEYTNRQLANRARRRIRSTKNPALSPSLKRLLASLPEGPFTAGELRHHIERGMDLEGLAESTRKEYRRQARRFVEELR